MFGSKILRNWNRLNETEPPEMLSMTKQNKNNLDERMENDVDEGPSPRPLVRVCDLIVDGAKHLRKLRQTFAIAYSLYQGILMTSDRGPLSSSSQSESMNYETV